MKVLNKLIRYYMDYVPYVDWKIDRLSASIPRYIEYHGDEDEGLLKYFKGDL